jgi:hypothetical protein
MKGDLQASADRRSALDSGQKRRNAQGEMQLAFRLLHRKAEHAGQFFPWTLAVHLVHAPHVAGLSRNGRMQIYVSAGTGTWGPPVRFDLEPCAHRDVADPAVPSAAVRAETSE